MDSLAHPAVQAGYEIYLSLTKIWGNFFVNIRSLDKLELFLFYIILSIFLLYIYTVDRFLYQITSVSDIGITDIEYPISNQYRLLWISRYGNDIWHTISICLSCRFSIVYPIPPGPRFNIKISYNLILLVWVTPMLTERRVVRRLSVNMGLPILIR